MRLARFRGAKLQSASDKWKSFNPAYTSQSCPKCSEKKKAHDRTYKCQCGFEKHRDIVGAMNIRYAPVADGNSLSA
nr:zinc ribbon domain-containing protein [Paenibacillus baekrokdamisoli]